MKKQIVILLSVVTLLTGLSACSKSTTDSSTDKKAETVKKSSKSEETKDSSEEKKVSSENKDTSSKFDNFDLMIEAAQSQTTALKQQFGEMFSDISITKGEGHTIVYTYIFSTDPGYQIDVEALKPALVKAMKPTIDATKAIFPDVKIQVIYISPDLTEFANVTITQADTDSIS